MGLSDVEEHVHAVLTTLAEEGYEVEKLRESDGNLHVRIDLGGEDE